MISNKEYKSNTVNNFLVIIIVEPIDYLNYNELKEAGKVSQLFNALVKKNRILIKFFKKKKSIFKFSCVKSIDSFSLLQNNTSFISDYSTTSNEGRMAV